MKNLLTALTAAPRCTVIIMTNYERVKAMSLEDMAAFVEAAGRNTCHKICVYRQGGENCKKMPCETGIKHWLESESE